MTFPHLIELFRVPAAVLLARTTGSARFGTSFCRHDDTCSHFSSNDSMIPLPTLHFVKNETSARDVKMGGLGIYVRTIQADWAGKLTRWSLASRSRSVLKSTVPEVHGSSCAWSARLASTSNPPR